MNLAKVRARLRAKSRVLPSGCWLWFGALNSKGYAVIHFNGQKVCAHRVSYMAFTGNTFKDDHDGHHTCGNKPCINPAHIQQVSHTHHPHYKYRKGYRRLEALLLY